MEHKEQRKRKGRRGDEKDRETPPCACCGAETRDDLVRAAVWGKRGLMVIEGINAQVCEHCGEEFYNEKDAQTVERLISDPPAISNQKLRVSVFSLTELGAFKKDKAPEHRMDQQAPAIESMYTRDAQDIQKTGDDQGNAEPFLCQYCGSETYPDTVKSVFWTEKGLAAIEDVPARVCKECREQFYDEEATGEIAELREQGFPTKMAKCELLVPVFSLTEIEET